MKNTIVVPVKWYVSILILYPTLSISANLACIDKYFNIDKEYQDYSELSVKEIHSQARAFYVKAFEKVLHYLPFHTRILEDLGFLNIKLRITTDIMTAVKRVAFKLPNVISGSEVDQLMNEWKLFTLDSSIGNILSPADQSSVLQGKPRLDVLWSRVHQLQGPSRDLKYPLIGKPTKAGLALAHGNADTERSFSDIANIMKKPKGQDPIGMSHIKCSSICEELSPC